tara:strand:+ start:1137 stop:1310 length:174 start_codon:yes stop_codon:yes gene_type:complete
MGIFNITSIVTPDQFISEVRTHMSTELGFTLTKEQAVERLCTIYLNEMNGTANRAKK